MAKVISLLPSMTVQNRFICRDSVSELSPDPWPSDQCSMSSSDPISAAGDLVSLAWLQKGDIIQIAPLDGEEETHTSLQNSTASFSSTKSENCSSLQYCIENDDAPLFPIQSISTSAVSVPSTIQTFSRPSSTDCYITCLKPELPYPRSLVSGHTHHGLSKPNYSYTHLIFMAIESAPQKCMTVNQIYNWCESNFPFYKQAGAGWKNSLRHNLSINKSFKRLPRDNRGPGRGAFWTVEPRERPALLDAIKRNPWNFSSFISGHSDVDMHSPFSITDVYGSQVAALRHVGLTQSAPATLLRAAGLGKPSLIDIHVDHLGNLIQAYRPGIQLLQSVDKAFVTPSDDQLVLADSAELTDAGVEQTIFPTYANDFEPEERDPSPERITVPNVWTAEEDENYRCILRALSDSQDTSVAVPGCNPLNSKCDDSLGSYETPLGNEASSTTLDGKLGSTKQRRKSRLQPTRTTSCNECKENAAAGCDACNLKGIHYSRNQFNDKVSSFDGQVVLDVANALDSDQEHGPAGGPAIRKTNHSQHHGSTNRNGRIVDDSSQEVYVTPAPYIDHEYSHCQAQLRSPDDNRMVNRYNETYFMETVQRFSRYRMSVKRRVRGRATRYVPRNPSSRSRYVSDFPSSDDQDRCTDEDDGNTEELSDHNDLCLLRHRARSIAPFHKRGRYKRSRGVRHQGSDRLVPEELLAVRPAVSKQMSVRLAKFRSENRRSKRVIRAPRRLYDDDLGLLSDADAVAVGAGSARRRDRMKYLKAARFGNSTRAGRRGRRGRKRGSMGRTRSRPFAPSESDQDYRSECYEDDEESRYLQLAYERQKMHYLQAEEEIVSQSSPQSSGDASPLPFAASGCSSHHNLGHAWSHSKIASTGQCNSRSWGDEWAAGPANDDDFTEEEDVSEPDVLEQIPQDCDVLPKSLENSREPATRKAAKLLLGMSQIESFRRLSGYVNLDSSGTSTELTGELSPPHEELAIENGPRSISSIHDSGI